LFFFSIWSEFEFYQQILEKLSAVPLVTKISPAGAEFNEDRPKDGHDEANSRFFFLRVDAPTIFKIKLTVTHSRDPPELELCVSVSTSGLLWGQRSAQKCL